MQRWIHRLERVNELLKPLATFNEVEEIFEDTKLGATVTYFLDLLHSKTIKLLSNNTALHLFFFSAIPRKESWKTLNLP